MHHTILLALSLASQIAAEDDLFWPPSSPVPIAQPASPGAQTARAELDFIGAVEDFVCSTTPFHVPPEPYGSLITGLGARCYHCREIATRRLRRASERDPRWLWWALRSRDPEIRLRASMLLDFNRED